MPFCVSCNQAKQRVTGHFQTKKPCLRVNFFFFLLFRFTSFHFYNSIDDAPFCTLYYSIQIYVCCVLHVCCVAVHFDSIRMYFCSFLFGNPHEAIMPTAMIMVLVANAGLLTTKTAEEMANYFIHHREFIYYIIMCSTCTLPHV